MSQITQIQAQQCHLDSNIEQLFRYHVSYGKTKHFPFRIGDIVRVTDWGWCYSSYTKAFVFLTGSREPPYYSFCKREQEGDKQLFKIINIAEHEFINGDIVCYIQDRLKRGVVIAPEGLKLVKQFPLRKNETNNIILGKIGYESINTDTISETFNP